MTVKDRIFSLPTLWKICAVGASISLLGGSSASDTPEKAEVSANLPSSLEEARGRARWLHEVIHGALQVMHRDFFDEDEVEHSLPSQSLDDVFAEMARSHGVGIRWLGVNATKGKNHVPKDRFEEKASAALAAGEQEYEYFDGKSFRFVGRIRLQNECLKCHVPDRTSLDDRVAGLALSFPLESPKETKP